MAFVKVHKNMGFLGSYPILFGLYNFVATFFDTAFSSEYEHYKTTKNIVALSHPGNQTTDRRMNW